MVCRNLDAVRTLTETSELWMATTSSTGSTSAMSDAVGAGREYSTLASAMAHMRSMCVDAGRRRHNQQLLLNLGVHDQVHAYPSPLPIPPPPCWNSYHYSFCLDYFPSPAPPSSLIPCPSILPDFRWDGCWPSHSPMYLLPGPC
jgi:hypothetical protein